MSWCPRSDPREQAADARSRHFDNEDWGPDYLGFRKIVSFATKPFSIDLFTTLSNAKCMTFVSKFVLERSVAYGINAFSLNLRVLQYFYACPPPRLGIPVLIQAAEHKCQGVLIVPKWPAAHFWPYLFPDGIHFCSMVRKYKTFRPNWLGPMFVAQHFMGLQHLICSCKN